MDAINQKKHGYGKRVANMLSVLWNALLTILMVFFAVGIIGVIRSIEDKDDKDFKFYTLVTIFNIAIFLLVLTGILKIIY